MARTSLFLDTILWFGKYKGMTVREVMVENPGWVDWVAKNVTWVTISDEVIEARASGVKEVDWLYHKEKIESVLRGLDSVGKPNGMRECHGISRYDDVHTSLKFATLLIEQHVQKNQSRN